MNMFKKGDLIENQMENAKVVLSYQDRKMRITCENASPATYGFVISEMLSDIAEKHPKMILALCAACYTFLESHGKEAK